MRKGVRKLNLREKVKSFLSDTGGTITAFCKKMETSTTYYYKWMKKDVEFSDRLICRIEEFLNEVYAK